MAGGLWEGRKRSAGNREARRKQAMEYVCHKITGGGDYLGRRKVLELGRGLEEGSAEGWIRTSQDPDG